MTNILLLEDDTTLGSSLKERLQKEQCSVIWAQTVQDAVELFSKNRFDLLILDIRLPDGSGLAFGRDIRMSSDVPIIFLTAMNSAELRLDGYEMGADDFIPKPFHLRELILRIKKVLTSRGHILGDISVSGMTLFRAGFAIQFSDGHRETLAQRDFELLFLLAKASPNIVSREEIIDQLWKNEPTPNSRTIDNAIVRLRAHLRKRTDSHLKTVRGIGYQWFP